jgi:hypothetical protein
VECQLTCPKLEDCSVDMEEKKKRGGDEVQMGSPRGFKLGGPSLAGLQTSLRGKVRSNASSTTSSTDSDPSTVFTMGEPGISRLRVLR